MRVEPLRRELLHQHIILVSTNAARQFQFPSVFSFVLGRKHLSFSALPFLKHHLSPLHFNSSKMFFLLLLLSSSSFFYTFFPAVLPFFVPTIMDFHRSVEASKIFSSFQIPSSFVFGSQKINKQKEEITKICNLATTRTTSLVKSSLRNSVRPFYRRKRKSNLLLDEKTCFGRNTLLRISLTGRQ